MSSNNFARFSMFFIPALFLVWIITKSASAEIATTKDWIGLFEKDPAGTKGCTSADDAASCRKKTVNSNSWGYPSNRNATTGVCDQKPGTIPKTSDFAGCKIIPDPFPTSGTFEYRMYAYDGGNPEALIATSQEMKLSTNTDDENTNTDTRLPCPQQATIPRVRNGLITTPNNSGNFSNITGTCVIGDESSFAPYKIPTYADLKSIYFDQAKTIPGIVTRTSSPASLPISLDENKLYHFTGDLTISSPSHITGSQAGVIFVDGKLNIGPISGDKLTGTSGLVFVVQKDVFIDKTITEINAVIISQGTIYTATTLGASCTPNSVTHPKGKLTVDGSLISINQDTTSSIVFCRSLGTTGAISDKNSPAEVINNNPKYLVILRNLMSSTLQKWSEVQ